VYLHREYPVATDQPAYEQLDALAEQLHATYRPVHSVVADPAAQPTSVRHLFGNGLFVSQDPEMQCNDVEHLRATLPDRFDQVASQISGLVRMSKPATVAHHDFHNAASGTRWLRAWQPDLIASVGLSQFALHSIVASHLLDVPRLLVLDSLRGNPQLRLMLPLYVQQANWILVADNTVRQELITLLGTQIEANIFSRDSSGEAPQHLITSIRERIASPRTTTQLTLGPIAAPQTARAESTARVHAATPLIVLGAERCGSNLLVNMLRDHPKMLLANELFNPRLIEQGSTPWKGACDLEVEQMQRLQRTRPAELLDYFMRKGQEQSTTYAGFKLLYYHGLADDRVTDMLIARDDLRVVHLLRENYLERFASYVRAVKADSWFDQANAQTTHQEAIHINPRDMATDFVQTAQFESRYRSMFQDHQVLEIDYRELSTNRAATMARLGDWLGLDLSLLSPKNQKTGPTDVKKGIANWQDVQQALKGTRWFNLTEADA
jgi:LPS sulfotransferase NodH